MIFNHQPCSGGAVASLQNPSSGRTLLARSAIVHCAATSNPHLGTSEQAATHAVACRGRYLHSTGREDAAGTRCNRASRRNLKPPIYKPKVLAATRGRGLVREYQSHDGAGGRCCHPVPKRALSRNLKPPKDGRGCHARPWPGSRRHLKHPVRWTLLSPSA